MDQEQSSARRSLFAAGIIGPWYLRRQQLDIYELLLCAKNPFVECARRFGKTTTFLCYAFERMIQNSGFVTLWGEPWKNQARDIVMPEIEILMRLAPKRVRPRFQTMDSVYIFPNDSRLKLRGVNDDRGESCRGPFAHLIIGDEFGSWKDPNYVVQSAMRPQLETTDGQFLFSSTPPDDLGHPYYTHKEWAIAEGRFIQKTVDDKDWLSPEKRAELVRDYGGDHTDAWKREQLCLEIANSEKLVVPEYGDGRTCELPADYARPQYFDAYVGGDSGADDNTAVLFAHHHFEGGYTVIEDELVTYGKTTHEIVEEAKRREQDLWGTKPGCACRLADYNIGPKFCLIHGLQPYRRVYDADKQLLIDISTGNREKGISGYPVELPEKSDKIAAIRWFRRLVQEGRVKIHPRCRILRRQLRVGQWANEKHLDFQRSADEELKHLDALISAIYLLRSIIPNHNPIPQAVADPFRQFSYPEQVSPRAVQDEEAMASALDPLGG